MQAECANRICAISDAKNSGFPRSKNKGYFLSYLVALKLFSDFPHDLLFLETRRLKRVSQFDILFVYFLIEERVSKMRILKCYVAVKIISIMINRLIWCNFLVQGQVLAPLC